ncbi:MAG: L,D-transpeptidase family protein [Candidatus Latescibacterota bacterium]
MELSIRNNGIVRRVFRKITKMRRRRRLIASLIVLAIAVSTGLAIALLTAEQPPVEIYQQALLAASRAREAEAGRYAPELLRAAELCLEEARFTWQMENSKWSPRRDFGKARAITLDAMQRAEHAEQRSIVMRDSLKSYTISHLQRISTEIKAFQSYYGAVPINRPLRQCAVKSEVLVKSSRAAFERGDYLAAAEKVQEAAKLIDYAASQSEEFLRAYMTQVAQWRLMAQETIAWSARKKAVAIIVDKMDRVCKVYRSGKLSQQFSIELGPNWIGDKRQRGDKATPEGRYHVCTKKGPGETRYYKALEIDYPNEADMKRFREAKKRGQLSASAAIGGIIEIHGKGGRGENWTEGCVALTNADMDHVFNAAEVGTPVTIVGALDPDALGKNNHARSQNGP